MKLFYIKKLDSFNKIFDKKLALAPMEDVTEPPFRLICKRLGSDISYTEFISSEGLIRDARKARNKLVYYEEERPVGIQIFGADTGVMIEAAKIAESANPDFIDINCGCWERCSFTRCRSRFIKRYSENA
jgi:tRNA-dihydrouridine synthase